MAENPFVPDELKSFNLPPPTGDGSVDHHLNQQFFEPDFTGRDLLPPFSDATSEQQNSTQTSAPASPQSSEVPSPDQSEGTDTEGQEGYNPFACLSPELLTFLDKLPLSQSLLQEIPPPHPDHGVDSTSANSSQTPADGHRLTFPSPDDPFYRFLWARTLTNFLQANGEKVIKTVVAYGAIIVESQTENAMRELAGTFTISLFVPL